MIASFFVGMPYWFCRWAIRPFGVGALLHIALNFTCYGGGTCRCCPHRPGGRLPHAYGLADINKEMREPAAVLQPLGLHEGWPLSERDLPHERASHTCVGPESCSSQAGVCLFLVPCDCRPAIACARSCMVEPVTRPAWSLSSLRVEQRFSRT